MKYLLIIFGTLTSLLFLGCANNGASFPQVADAPPFDYADGEELRSRMHQLAFELQLLDNSLVSDYNERQIDSQSVVDNLRNIERIGKTLQTGDISSKHPFLAEDMDNFLNNVSRALWDAERNSYYMSGRVSGACVACHRAAY